MYKAHLQIYNSKLDYAGNNYYAFSYIETPAGIQVVGKISGGPTNLRMAMREMGHEMPKDVYITEIEYPIRKFDRMVKTWGYAGCRPEEIAAFIKAELAKKA